MEDEYDSRVPARRLQKIDLAIITLNTLSDLFGAVADGFEMTVTLLAAHANYNVERAQFAERAALEIETITGGQDV
jgi:hypothetical protein